MLAERISEWSERFKQEAREENARSMLLETSIDDAMVAKLSGLDEARVAELRREIKR